MSRLIIFVVPLIAAVVTIVQLDKPVVKRHFQKLFGQQLNAAAWVKWISYLLGAFSAVGTIIEIKNLATPWFCDLTELCSTAQVVGPIQSPPECESTVCREALDRFARLVTEAGNAHPTAGAFCEQVLFAYASIPAEFPKSHRQANWQSALDTAEKCRISGAASDDRLEHLSASLRDADRDPVEQNLRYVEAAWRAIEDSPFDDSRNTDPYREQRRRLAMRAAEYIRQLTRADKEIDDLRRALDSYLNDRMSVDTQDALLTAYAKADFSRLQRRRLPGENEIASIQSTVDAYQRRRSGALHALRNLASASSLEISSITLNIRNLITLTKDDMVHANIRPSDYERAYDEYCHTLTSWLRLQLDRADTIGSNDLESARQGTAMCLNGGRTSPWEPLQAIEHYRSCDDGVKLIVQKAHEFGAFRTSRRELIDALKQVQSTPGACRAMNAPSFRHALATANHAMLLEAAITSGWSTTNSRAFSASVEGNADPTVAGESQYAAAVVAEMLTSLGVQASTTGDLVADVTVRVTARIVRDVCEPLCAIVSVVARWTGTDQPVRGFPDLSSRGNANADLIGANFREGSGDKNRRGLIFATLESRRTQLQAGN